MIGVKMTVQQQHAISSSTLTAVTTQEQRVPAECKAVRYETVLLNYL
jgi:hypothetical protein